ncbi:LysR family transcriptional regulator [Bordetella sp. 02P26C-1]|uniref:LysR family transcriptional regulator n=1 Tax=Bordetella sp. 02P26C-1 TaxID=2683195 RepID=UPI001355EB4E|nr:LysR family transcriptional regulator [Bordetella sp. 02P26C-1]MVW79600.1 LysR family transcriptional regulator [Bordetella sp. 02P26C-1]
MKLDPTSLRLFIAVVEEGSIAQAARREHLVAAAVSKRVAELEAILRAPLLKRSHRGVVPTEAGLTLLRLARHVVHTLEDTYAQMVDFAVGVRGQVRVFANISAITQFLPEDLATFSRLHPQVQIALEERNSADILKAVAQNEADVGIYTALAHNEDVETLDYEHDDLVLVVRKDHPLARRSNVKFDDLLDWDLVGLREGSAINKALEEGAARLGKSLRIKVHVTGYDALCLMVGAGMGIAVAPRHCARFYAAELNLLEVALDDPWSRRKLSICVRALASLPPVARLLVDHLQDCSAARRGSL